MRIISPAKIRVEQNDCVFEGLLQRDGKEMFVVMNSSIVKIHKNAVVTVLENFVPPVIESKAYVSLYADEDHDDLKERQDLTHYSEYLGINKEFE